jgi:hypothetical protein
MATLTWPGKFAPGADFEDLCSSAPINAVELSKSAL